MSDRADYQASPTWCLKLILSMKYVFKIDKVFPVFPFVLTNTGRPSYETSCKVYRETTTLARNSRQLGLLGVSICFFRFLCIHCYLLVISQFKVQQCRSHLSMMVTLLNFLISKAIIFVVGGFMEELQEPKLRNC